MVSPTPNPAPRGGELFLARFGGRRPKPRWGVSPLPRCCLKNSQVVWFPPPLTLPPGAGNFFWRGFSGKVMGFQPQPTQAVAAHKMSLYNRVLPYPIPIGEKGGE